MNLRRTSSLAALVFATVVGCAPAQAPAPRPAAAPAASSSAAAETIHAGTSGDYPPLSLWKDDRAEGFAPALLEAFAASERTPVAWTRFKWPELDADLAAGRFDVASDGITVRPERSVLGRFTVPIARGGAVLLVRRALAPSSANDVSALDVPGVRVVVNRGGHLERVTRGLFHAATVEAIPDNQGVRAAFARGDADAAMTNTFEAPRWSVGLDGVVPVGPLTRDVTALWVRADRPELGEQLDAWLLQEEAAGRLAQLRLKTIGPGGGEATALPLDALLAATVERLALMPFVAAAKKSIGKAVEDTAQEARVLAAANEAVAKAAAKHATTPPPASLVEAFFRAQIEAAKDVQEHDAPPAGAPKLALDTELRPAIARITARMAFLIVRLPRGGAREEILGHTRDFLAKSGVGDARIERLAASLTALSAP